jgi:hypothetical protein
VAINRFICWQALGKELVARYNIADGRLPTGWRLKIVD